MLGDNTEGGKVIPWPIRFQCAEVPIVTGLHATDNVLTHCRLAHVRAAQIRLALVLPNRSCCLSRSVSVLF
jgi:hypothetical protein